MLTFPQILLVIGLGFLIYICNQIGLDDGYRQGYKDGRNHKTMKRV